MKCMRGSFELTTHGLGIWLNKGISLTLRHGWQCQVIEKNVRNAQVVPILYSRDCYPPRQVCLYRSRWRLRSHLAARFAIIDEMGFIAGGEQRGAAADMFRRV